MTRRSLMLAAAGGSLALLAGAFVFQWLGYAPCKLCIWQRWPHGMAILAGAGVLALGPLVLLGLLGALSALTTAAIGVYHAGIERGLWPGPDTCTGDAGGLAGLSGSDLLSTEIPADIVLCDQIAWEFLGVSMAGWNAALSFVLAGLWIAALRRAA